MNLKSIKACRTRTVLTETQALEIYRFKVDNKIVSRSESGRAARILSKKYSVTEKAIRDIWRGRTWRYETMHLGCSKSVILKRPGRPKTSPTLDPSAADETAISSFPRTETSFQFPTQSPLAFKQSVMGMMANHHMSTMNAFSSSANPALRGLPPHHGMQPEQPLLHLLADLSSSLSSAANCPSELRPAMSHDDIRVKVEPKTTEQWNSVPQRTPSTQQILALAELSSQLNIQSALQHAHGNIQAYQGFQAMPPALSGNFQETAALLSVFQALNGNGSAMQLQRELHGALAAQSAMQSRTASAQEFLLLAMHNQCQNSPVAAMSPMGSQMSWMP